MIGNWPSAECRTLAWVLGSAFEHEAEHRDEHEQQREQRDEAVVGDQRRELAGLVVAELLDHRGGEAEPGLRCWKRSRACRCSVRLIDQPRADRRSIGGVHVPAWRQLHWEGGLRARAIDIPACLPDVSRKCERWTGACPPVEMRASVPTRCRRWRWWRRPARDAAARVPSSAAQGGSGGLLQPGDARAARAGSRGCRRVLRPARIWRTCSSSVSSRASTTAAARCGGRSPAQAALDGALPLGGDDDGDIEVADVRAEIDKLVMLRMDLRSLGRSCES